MSCDACHVMFDVWCFLFGQMIKSDAEVFREVETMDYSLLIAYVQEDEQRVKRVKY